MCLFLLFVGHVSGIIANKLFVFGGFDGTNYITGLTSSPDPLQTYTNSIWVSSFGYIQAALAVYNEQYAYFSGGVDNNNVINNNKIYRTTIQETMNTQETIAATLPVTIGLHCSVTYDNYVIIIGGATTSAINSNLNNQQYYMLINTVDGTLGPVLSTTIPVAMKRYDGTLLVFKQKMYMVIQIIHYYCY
jgi:N-acetylneuraminic acid mutarotase